jgi:DNA (cytosine-5)-methyltransferase 1
MGRIIEEVQPRYAFIENSSMLVTRGLETVLEDLAEMGFDAEWGCISASDVGAPHKRERLWIVAHAKRNNNWRANGFRWREREQGQTESYGDGENGDWPIEPKVDRVVDGLALKLDKTHTSQLRCLGNGQVPRVAAAAWMLLTHNA